MGKERTAGSLRGCAIDGVPYDVAADADVNRLLGQWENEMLATSGEGMLKKTKRIQLLNDLGLSTSAADKAAIEAIVDSLEDVPFRYTDAAGNQFSCTGQLSVNSDQSSTNITVITVQPRGKWTTILAS